ncbi:MAG: hypothetical protein N838_30585 [Thiohalocapsa sp. PB-PSB1]|nr:MAG: hypothetical protein N838_30585 [Thiohalocapsa sp. PB-PSB1]
MKKLTFLLTLALALATAVAFAQSQINAPPSSEPAPTVNSVDTGAPVDVEIYIEDEEAQPPDHPPLDQVPPMPMPDASAGTVTFGEDVANVVYDPSTGEEIQINPGPSSLFGDFGNYVEGYNGSDGAEGGTDLDLLMTFGNMYTVNPQEFPWRMNVKLLMQFGSRYFVCSGAMVDAETVFTAGHCVFEHGGAGWADNIWVYPGWDGGAHDPDAEFFGEAKSSLLLSNTGWTTNGDVNWDVGAIRVTRAVGALTGWYGYVWDGSCSWHLGKTYHNPSYPSESCGGGLHTGTDMYYWFGNFDSCPTSNNLQIDTSGGCFNAGWGGMSGSGFYYIDGSSRYVHATASTSNRSTWFRAARLYGSFVTGTGGLQDFIRDSRGSSFDLQALDMASSGGTTFQAGSTLPNITHLATNPTNGTSNDTFQFRVYLSSNDNISSSDTLISTRTLTWNFAAMGSVIVGSSGMTIPANTPPGTYWLGVEYDPGVDGNSSNNDTDDWDALPIVVTAAPSYRLTVSKSGTGNGTVSSTPSGIDCGSDCNEDYTSGTSVTLSASPASDSTFGGWSGACSGSSPTCTLTMSAARSVTAKFNKRTYRLSVTKSGTGTGTVESSPAGINCGTDCSEDYTAGTSVTLKATPSGGSTFGGWGGACSGSSTTCTLTMSAVRSVTARFDPPTIRYRLSVTKSGSGTGTVESSPAGINCGSDCSEDYPDGTSVTLTATPLGGSTFGGWSGACSGSSTTCTLTMSAARSVTANFNPPNPQDHRLSVDKSGSGTGTVESSPSGINCGSDCSEDYPDGTSVTLTATPLGGSTFGGWSGACSGSSTTCTLTMSAPRSVTARFNGGTPGDPDAWLSPETQTVSIGNAFEIDVLVNSRGQQIGAFDLGISFDPSLIQVDESQCNDGVCAGADGFDPAAVSTDNAAGTITINGFSITGIGPGSALELLTIHFDAQQTEGTTPVDLQINTLANPLGSPIGNKDAEGATVEISDVLCGDADSNGVVNIIDALAVARSVAGLPPPPTVDPAAADVNGDGVVNIIDALLIARFVAGLPVTGTCLM